MLKSVFNGIYLLLFLQFLRGLYAKVVPMQSDRLPKYLILAMFDDKAILFGYSDSLRTCQEYSRKSRWGITISEFTGSGYRDIDGHALGKGVEDARNKANTCNLETIQENMDFMDTERDLELIRQFGFDPGKSAQLVAQFRHGNYV
jgi:hypothetical protein